MELIFDNEDKKSKYLNYFKNYTAKGFLLEKHDIIPIVILDLAPEFNISKNKLKYVQPILDNIINETNIKPYITSVYKTPIMKKKNIELDNDIYSLLYMTCKELSYVIQNFYYNYNDVMIICLGKYSEYSYLINILSSILRNDLNDINLNKIYNRHLSFILESDDKNTQNQIINSDIGRINKVLDVYKLK